MQTQLNAEYAERAFQTIENSEQIETLSPGLGRLLVSHARAVLIMKSVVEKLSEDLDNHLKTVFIDEIIRFHQCLLFLLDKIQSDSSTSN